MCSESSVPTTSAATHNVKLGSQPFQVRVDSDGKNTLPDCTGRPHSPSETDNQVWTEIASLLKKFETTTRGPYVPTTETALAVFEERGDTYAKLAHTMRAQLVTQLVTEQKHTERDTEDAQLKWLGDVCLCVNAKMAAIYATNCYQQTKKGIESCRRHRFAVPPMSQVIVTERRAASGAWKWFNAGLKEHTGPLSPRLEGLLKNKRDEYSVAAGSHFEKHYIRSGDPVCLTSDDLTEIFGRG